LSTQNSQFQQSSHHSYLLKYMCIQYWDILISDIIANLKENVYL